MGGAEKGACNTLKSNGEALEVQMQASEEGRQKRHEATLEISKEQWQMDMALRKEQLEIDKKKNRARHKAGGCLIANCTGFC